MLHIAVLGTPQGNSIARAYGENMGWGAIIMKSGTKLLRMSTQRYFLTPLYVVYPLVLFHIPVVNGLGIREHVERAYGDNGGRGGRTNFRKGRPKADRWWPLRTEGKVRPGR